MDHWRVQWSRTADRIVLFGSRARGDARDDSDYDVAVFLKNMTDRRDERRRLGLLRFHVLEETGESIDLEAFAAEDYEQRTGLMRDIRRQGAAL